MITTTYTDRHVIHRSLEQLHQDATDVVKDLAVATAAKLDDLGITITETRDEYLEVRGRIPDNLLFQVAEVHDHGIFVHGRIDDLPATGSDGAVSL
jgi:hypothetical protein